MNRIDRLFGIMTQLQSKKYVAAEKIADMFNISVRTVYRDIKALIEQGIPVSFEQNKGYFIMAGYFLPPVSFSSEEAGALLLMETMVYSVGDQSIGLHYSSALAKVKAVLRSPQKEKLEFLSQNTRFQFPACANNNFSYLTLIQNAICSKTILEIGYQNNTGEVSKRLVEPIGLVYYAGSWHLIAWCHVRQTYRDFKVSRVLHITRTEQVFTKQGHLELNDYMKLLPVNY